MANPFDLARKAVQAARSGLPTADFINADFSQEYGALKYQAAVIGGYQADLPVSVQSELAGRVANMFSKVFQAWRNDNPVVSALYPDNRTLLANNSGLAQQVFAAPFGASDIGSMFPLANGIKTYGDAADLLFQANAGGIIKRTQRMVGLGQEGMDVYQTSAQSFYQNLPFYQQGTTDFPRYINARGFYDLKSFMRADRAYGNTGKVGLENMLGYGSVSTSGGILNETISSAEYGVPVADIFGFSQRPVMPPAAAVYEALAGNRPGRMMRAPSYVNPLSPGGKAGIQPGTQLISGLTSQQMSDTADWLENGQSIVLGGFNIHGTPYAPRREYKRLLEQPGADQLAWSPPIYVPEQNIPNDTLFENQVASSGRWLGGAGQVFQSEYPPDLIDAYPGVGFGEMRQILRKYRASHLRPENPDQIAQFNSEGALPFLPAGPTFNPYDAVADDQSAVQSGKFILTGGSRAIQESWSTGQRVGDDPLILQRQRYDLGRPRRPNYDITNLPTVQDMVYDRTWSSIPAQGVSANVVEGGDATAYRRQVKAGVDPETGEEITAPNPITNWMTPDQQASSRVAYLGMKGMRAQYQQNLALLKGATYRGTGPTPKGKISRQAMFMLQYSGKDVQGFQDALSQVAGAYDIPISYTPGQEDAFEEAFAGLDPMQQAQVRALFPSFKQQLDWSNSAADKLYPNRSRLPAGDAPAPAHAETGYRINIPGGHAQGWRPMGQSGRSRDKVGFFDFDQPQPDEGATPAPVRMASPTGDDAFGSWDPGVPDPSEGANPADFNAPGGNTRAAHNARNRAQNAHRRAPTTPASQRFDPMTAEYMMDWIKKPERLSGFFSGIYGSHQRSVDPVTGAIRDYMGTTNGEVLVPAGETSAALRIASETIGEAMAGLDDWDNPTEKMATVVNRTGTGLRSRVKQYESRALAQGATEVEAKEAGTAVKTVAKDLLDQAVKRLTEGFQAAGQDPMEFREMAYKAQSVFNKQFAAELSAARPALANAVAERTGLSLEDASQLPMGQGVTVADPDTGLPYSFGQVFEGSGDRGTRGPKGPNGPGGLFGKAGKAGSLFYGAYMLKRLYGMSLGPEMQKAEQYGTFLRGAGEFGLYGTGTDVANTQAGYSGRVAVGNLYMGQGAYEEFGGFSELPYMLSGAGGGASRLYSSATAAGTFGIGGYIAGGMMNMMGLAAEGSFGASVAGALGPIGLGIAGTVLAGSIAMEIANAGRSPDQEPITWGNMLRNTAQAGARGRGIAAYLQAHPEEAKKYKSMPYGRGSIAVPGGFQYNTDETWKAIAAADPEGLRVGMSTPDQAYAFYEYNPEIKKAADLSGILVGQGFTQDASDAAIAMMTRAGGGMPSPTDVTKLGINATSAAMTPGQLKQASWTYAESVGQIPGTSGFASTSQFYEQFPESGRSRLDYQAARLRSLTGMVEGFLGTNSQGVAAQQLQGWGVQTTMQAQSASGFMRAYETYKGPMSDQSFGNLTGYSMMNNAYVNSTITNAMELGGMAGANPEQIAGALSGIGMSNQQASLFNGFMSGDLGAFSYASWQNPSVDTKWRLFDQSGRSIIQTNGAQAMNTYRGWMQSLYPGIQGMGSNDDIAQRMGMTDPGLRDAFLNGYQGFSGFQGTALKHADDMFGFQMAGIGVQYKGIQLQQHYLWGNGSWSNPASNSMWGLEDQSRQMQYDQSMWQYAFSGRQMEMQNQFAIRREDISWQQMNASQGYNNWQMGANYNQQMMQRGWAQEDWQYQDTTRNLSFEWQQQDYAYNIRYATGRQRQQLVRERDRSAMSFSLEGEQIDKTRDRQKETWALEDERYQKTKAYTLDLQNLDRQSWQLNREQRVASYKMEQEQLAKREEDTKKEFALQTQIIEAQRKYQMEQIELQKQSLGIQAAAATAQHTYEENMTKTTENWGALVGMVEQLSKYDRSFQFVQSFTTMAQVMNSQVSVDKINKIIDLLRQLSNFNGLLPN